MDMPFHLSAYNSLANVYYSEEITLKRPLPGQKPDEGATGRYTVYSTVSKNQVSVCYLCQSKPTDPVYFCQSKQHILCRSCYQNMPDEHKKRCTLCESGYGRRAKKRRTYYRKPRSHVEIQTLITNEQLTCPAVCGNNFSRSELQKHFSSCRPFPCLFCDFNGSPDEVLAHRDQCLKQSVRCEYCQRDYLRGDKQPHQARCEEFPVTAELPGGQTTRMPRKRASAVQVVHLLYQNKKPALVPNEGADSPVLPEQSYPVLQTGVQTVVNHFIAEQRELRERVQQLEEQLQELEQHAAKQAEQNEAMFQIPGSSVSVPASMSFQSFISLPREQCKARGLTEYTLRRVGEERTAFQNRYLGGFKVPIVIPMAMEDSPESVRVRYRPCDMYIHLATKRVERSEPPQLLLGFSGFPDDIYITDLENIRLELTAGSSVHGTPVTEETNMFLVGTHTFGFELEGGQSALAHSDIHWLGCEAGVFRRVMNRIYADYYQFDRSCPIKVQQLFPR